MRNKKLNIMVEGAMMIALATVLSYIKFWKSPYGGSVTLEMLPLIVFGLRRGPKWGIFVGFVHGLIQMVMGFENVLYCNTLLSQIGCILLDYLLAFAGLGMAQLFSGKFSNQMAGATVGAVCCGLWRFLMSFLSGWLLWGSYAWEGWNPCLYSLAYNAIYMVPNIIILAIIVPILCKAAPQIMAKQD